MRAPGTALRRRLDRRHPDDAGFTLVELMVAMLIFAILIGMTVPVISTFYSVDTSVTNTVGSVGQILPATTVLGRYLRSAVAPAPGGIPPFAPIGSPAAPGYPAGTLYQAGTNQMTFYSNTGDQVPSGGTQVALGPRLVTLTVSGPQPKTAYTLTLASQVAKSGTCPGSSPAMSQTAGATCSYAGQAAKLDFVIGNVTNGSATDPNPIFQYIVGVNSSGLPNVITPANKPAGTSWSCPSTCIPVTAAAVTSVTGVQLDVETQNTIGSLTSFRSTVLFFAPNYSTNVG